MKNMEQLAMMLLDSEMVEKLMQVQNADDLLALDPA